MSEEKMNILITIGVIVVVFTFIYLLDKKVSRENVLFGSKPGKVTRILAFLFGIVFMSFAGMKIILFASIDYLFIILGFALIFYALGFQKILQKIEYEPQKKLGIPLKDDLSISDLSEVYQPQKGIVEKNQIENPQTNRIFRFIKLFIILLILSILFIGVCYWASTHQDNPLADVLVIGVIVIYCLMGLIGIIMETFNLGNILKRK